MPLSNEFWNLYYQGMGIDPLAQNRDQLLSMYSPVVEPTYRGLLDDQWNYNNAYGDRFTPGDIASGIAATQIGRIGETFADVGNAIYGGLGMDNWIAPRNEAGYHLPWSETLIEGGQAMTEQAGVRFESGGGALQELAAGGLDWGSGGPGLSPWEAVQSGIGTLAGMAGSAAPTMLTAGLAAPLAPALGGEGIGSLLGGSMIEASGTSAAAAPLAYLGGASTTGSATMGEMISGTIMAGMGADSAADTYLTRKEMGDSTINALAIGATNWLVQGKLEQLGWEAALGKGATYFGLKDKVVNGRVANAALGTLFGATTEGAEEVAQAGMDAISKNLPMDDSFFSVEPWMKAWEQFKENAPEAGFQGALFGGGLGGMVHAYTKPLSRPEQVLGATDHTAKGGDINNPIPGPSTQEHSSDTIVNAETLGSTLPPIPEIKQDIFTVQNKAAEASKIAEQAAMDTIEQLVNDEEKQRAFIASSINPEMADKIGDYMNTSITNAGNEAAARVNEVFQLYLQSTGQAPVQPNELFQVEGAEEMLPQAEIAPEQIAPMIMSMAQQYGIMVRPEQLADPNAINWQEIADQNKQQAENDIRLQLSNTADAIRGAINLNPDSPIHALAGVARQRAEATIEQKQPMSSGPSSRVQTMRTNAMVYEPDLSQQVMKSGSAYHPLAYLMSSKGSLLYYTDKNGDQQSIPPHEYDVSTILNRHYGVDVIDSIPGARESIADLESDVEAYRAQSKMSPADKYALPREEQRQLTTIREKAVTLQERLVSAYGLHKVTGGLTNVNVSNNEPFMKWLSHNLWQTASDEDMAILKDAVLIPSPDLVSSVPDQSSSWTDPVTGKVHFSKDKKVPSERYTKAADAVGAMARRHLESQGLGRTLVTSDGVNVSDRALGAMVMQSSGKVMSPLSMKRIMMEAGIPDLDSDAALALIDAMSTRWMSQNPGKTVFEFYDRLGDTAEVQAGSASSAAGEAIARTPDEVRGKKMFQKVLDGARGLVRLFRHPGMQVSTMIHEVVHLLEMSGLMEEMLSPTEFANLSKWLGWKPGGVRTREQGEKLTRGFERFLYEGKVPNSKIGDAFRTLKYSVSHFVNNVLRAAMKLAGKTGTFDNRMPFTERAALLDQTPGAMAYDFHGVKVPWADTKLNTDVMRAFYQLLNVDENGAELEYAATAGAPLLARALERSVTESIGIDATGMFTDTQPEALKGTALSPTPRDTAIEDALVDRFFVTTILKEAMLILPDGRMIKTDQEHYTHTKMAQAIGLITSHNFLQAGIVRRGALGGFEIASQITELQAEEISNSVVNLPEHIDHRNIDITDDSGGTVGVVQVTEGQSPREIRSAIHREIEKARIRRREAFRDWPSATGQINSTFDGTAMDMANENMANEREGWEELQKAPLAMPKDIGQKEPMRSGPSARATNKAKIEALGKTDNILDEASSILYEEVQDYVADKLIAGQKDVDNYGNRVDGSGSIKLIDNLSRVLFNFGTGIQHFMSAAKEGTAGAYLKSLSGDFRVGTYKVGKNTFDAIMKTVWGIGNKYETFFRETLGLPEWADFVNSLYAAGKLVHKVMQQVPQVYDPAKHEWVPIPGGQSMSDIMTNFGNLGRLMWKMGHSEYIKGRTFEEFHQDIIRDLSLYMLAQRQMEIANNVAATMATWNTAVDAWRVKAEAAKAAGKVFTEKKPERPTTTQVNPTATNNAMFTLSRMNLRYGKDIAAFEKTALDLSRWENLMVLYKLNHAGHITDKEYGDMMAMGVRYVPLTHLKHALNNNGILNVRLDESMYKVVDYLKNDTMEQVVDPLVSMVKRAKAVELLTYRQHGRNKLGQVLLRDFDAMGTKGPATIFTKDKQVTEAEWSKEKSVTKFSKVRRIKNLDGTITTSTSYFVKEPLRGAEAEAAVKELRKKIMERARKKSGALLTEDDARAMLEKRILSFYPEGEKGNPMYVWINDDDLAQSIFYMNNPQVMFFESMVERFKSAIDGQRLKATDDISRAGWTFAKMATNGFLGFGGTVKRAVTANLQFVYNSLFRDIPQAIAKSRQGVTLGDWVNAAKESFMLNFPTLRELDPAKHWLSIDASRSTGAFSGLITQDLKDMSEAELFSWLGARGRNVLLEQARGGSKKALAKLLWQDFRDFGRSEGMTHTPWETLQRAYNGPVEVAAAMERLKDPNVTPDQRKKLEKVIKESTNATLRSPVRLPVSVYNGFATGLRLIGNIFENTPRMAERQLSMAVDLNKYPRLHKLYSDPTGRAGFSAMRFKDGKQVIQYGPDGKTVEGGGFLAYTFGKSHRAQWREEERRMDADPNYMPPLATLPVQYNSAQRDAAMAHVTTNFSGRGTMSHTLETFNIFFNPAQQDTYGVVRILSNASVVRRALYNWGREKNAPKNKGYENLQDQFKFDSHAYSWLLKNFTYLTLPAMFQLAWFMLGADDDDRDKWNAQTFIEKLSYIHIPTPWSDNPIRLATGVGFANLLFRDLPMSAAMDMANTDPKAMSKWFDRFFDGTGLASAAAAGRIPFSSGSPGGTMGAAKEFVGSMPVVSSEALNPLYELFTNWDKFRNRPIALENMSGVSNPEVARDKYNALTDLMASSLDMQPAQIKYVLSRYFPGIRGAVPLAVNEVLEDVPVLDAQAGSMPSNAPGAGPVGQSLGLRLLARDPWGYGQEGVQDVLSLYRKSEQYRTDMKNMNESRIPGYMKDHPISNDDIYFELKNMSKSIKDSEAAAKRALYGEGPEWAGVDESSRKFAAMEIRRLYTLHAIELARKAYSISIGGE